MNCHVALTGASGFVGQALVQRLTAGGFGSPRALRLPASLFQNGGSALPSADETANLSALWAQQLHGVEVLIHLAARVHVMNDTAQAPLSAFRAANVWGTQQLARAAAGAGVKRFVYISSVKVNGESTEPGRPFGENDAPNPSDDYAQSKYEAESSLHDIAAQTGIQVVIIRPPLVYGPGVRANLAALIGAVQRGLPLPLGAVHNKRSLIGLDNLCDLIATCMCHAAAANQTFMVSDGEDLSTTVLIRRLASAMGRPARLLSVPVPLLRAAATLVGQSAAVRRLCGNLQVDTTKAHQLLGWRPAVSVDEGLRRTTVAMLRP